MWRLISFEHTNQFLSRCFDRKNLERDSKRFWLALLFPCYKTRYFEIEIWLSLSDWLNPTGNRIASGTSKFRNCQEQRLQLHFDESSADAGARTESERHVRERMRLLGWWKLRVAPQPSLGNILYSRVRENRVDFFVSENDKRTDGIKKENRWERYFINATCFVTYMFDNYYYEFFV